MYLKKKIKILLNTLKDIIKRKSKVEFKMIFIKLSTIFECFIEESVILYSIIIQQNFLVFLDSSKILYIILFPLIYNIQFLKNNNIIIYLLKYDCNKILLI